MSFLSYIYLDMHETTLCTSPVNPRSSILILSPHLVKSVQLPSNYSIHDHNKYFLYHNHADINTS